MLPRERPDRIYAALDDHRLAANTGLLLPVTLTLHLGLGELETATLTWEMRQVEPTRETNY